MSDSAKKETRAEAQERVDMLYASGQITLNDWRTLTDDLSSANWTAEGRQS